MSGGCAGWRGGTVAVVDVVAGNRQGKRRCQDLAPEDSDAAGRW